MQPGTVTFLFTDIEGSTKLLQRSGAAYGGVLARHRTLIEDAALAHHGEQFGTEGDAVFLAFASAPDALAAAVDAQLALAAEPWPGDRVAVRMGIHSGDVNRVGELYVGMGLHQVARVTAAGHGGQILVSEAAAALARDAIPPGFGLRDLGSHRLKDLPRPEHLFQVTGPGLAFDFPPLRTMSPATTTLPRQLTAFVGRAEISRARTLLADTRLLTITGPGGTGKTRLALEVAAELAGTFRDGATFVGLDMVREPGLVPAAIMAALGIVDTSGGDPLARLIDHLRDRELLLVLDNFEQVVDAGPMIGDLLRAAPGLKVLATSRIALRVSGEQELPLPPLSLPANGSSITAAAVSASEAGRLFEERVRAIQPDFRITEANAPIIAEIVTRLDGLPLAIELAAARTRILPLEALRSRLDAALGVLVGGARDLPARQQTLRGAIDWSYELLAPPDRRLFARCSVFAGGASLPDIETICGPADELGEELLDGCASLVEKSLMRALALDQPEPRFGMLVTIREYAAGRLREAGESDGVHERHASAYLGLAERLAPGLTGPAARPLLDDLEREHDNLRAALDWSVSAGRAAIALRLVTALWRFWQIRGHLYEASQRLETVLAMPGVGAEPALLQASALGAAGSVAYWRGAWAEANRWYAPAVELARASGDRAALADALYDFGFSADPTVRTQEARYVAGRAAFEEALPLYESLGDERGLARCHWALGIASAVTRDFADARGHLDACLHAFRRLEDPFGLGWALHILGLLDLFERRLDASRASFTEGMAIFRRSADLTGVLVLLIDFALQRRAEGDELVYWRLGGAIDCLRRQTGTNLVAEAISVIEWQTPADPPTDEARQAWADGEQLPLEVAVDEALAMPATRAALAIRSGDERDAVTD